jgi:hypothetical protein
MTVSRVELIFFFKLHTLSPRCLQYCKVPTLSGQRLRSGFGLDPDPTSQLVFPQLSVYILQFQLYTEII